MLIRIGPTLDRLAEMLKSLSGLFAEAGFARIEARHLFAAEQLIDLYGEDVRTRAYLLNDPLQGAELCLRPDFTVPIALAHGEGGWGRRAAYSYAGPVFRRQEAGSGRPIEYLQAGIESFGEADRDTADARILTLILRGLDALEAPPAAIRTGDLNIVFALLDALDMPPHRRAALR
ncbi:MAG: ATP phosphoribosyltransferase regulatory subunit, partial [Pseudomonadota bacterium]